MPATQINLRLDPEVLARVDVARGDVSRNRWIQRAVERELSDPSKMVVVDPRLLADAESRPLDKIPRQRAHQPGPNVEHVRSSSQSKRDVRPIPKRGKS